MKRTPKPYILAALALAALAACGSSSKSAAPSTGSTSAGSTTQGSTAAGSSTPASPTTTAASASRFDLTFTGEQKFHLKGTPRLCSVRTTSTPHQFDFDIEGPQFPQLGKAADHQGFSISTGLGTGIKWVAANGESYIDDGTGLTFSADLHDLKVDAHMVGTSGPNAVHIVGTVHCA